MADSVLAYTIVEACRVSGIGRTKLYAEIADGKIEAVKAGRRTLLNAKSLAAYVAALPAAEIRVGRKAAA
ncbi:excisionase family DNA-binding protein [Lichenicoccus sp.]|uniref:excisionase family DNA-binding protein n=1 Tax=Lichenicoccus sp. TaxID=2781899 RepID=UPI003D14277B